MATKYDIYTQTQFLYSIQDVDIAIRSGIGFTLTGYFANSYRYEFGILDRVIVQCFQEAPNITRVAISTSPRVKSMFGIGESFNQRRIVDKIITNLGQNLNRLPRKSNPQTMGVTTTADQLTKLASLLKQGLITREEFNHLKRKFLK